MAGIKNHKTRAHGGTESTFYHGAVSADYLMSTCRSRSPVKSVSPARSPEKEADKEADKDLDKDLDDNDREKSASPAKSDD